MVRARETKLFAAQLGLWPPSGRPGPDNFHRLSPLSSPYKILFRNMVGAQVFDVYNRITEIKTRTNMAVLTVVFLKIR